MKMTREEKEKAIPAKLATFLREHGRFNYYVELLDDSDAKRLNTCEIQEKYFITSAIDWPIETSEMWCDLADEWETFLDKEKLDELNQTTEQSTINTATYRPHEMPRRVEPKPPVHSGVLATFPDALEAVAAVAQFGADKYCSGKIGWNREVSKNHLESATRHLMRAGEFDDESCLLHSAHLAWRVLAALQIELENAEAK